VDTANIKMAELAASIKTKEAKKAKVQKAVENIKALLG
jgi:hypothetical protein